MYKRQKNGYILCVDVNCLVGRYSDLNLQENPGRCNWHIQKDGAIIEGVINSIATRGRAILPHNLKLKEVDTYV